MHVFFLVQFTEFLIGYMLILAEFLDAVFVQKCLHEKLSEGNKTLLKMSFVLFLFKIVSKALVRAMIAQNRTYRETCFVNQSIIIAKKKKLMSWMLQCNILIDVCIQIIKNCALTATCKSTHEKWELYVLENFNLLLRESKICHVIFFNLLPRFIFICIVIRIAF